MIGMAWPRNEVIFDHREEPLDVCVHVLQPPDGLDEPHDASAVRRETVFGQNARLHRQGSRVYQLHAPDGIPLSLPGCSFQDGRVLRAPEGRQNLGQSRFDLFRAQVLLFEGSSTVEVLILLRKLMMMTASKVMVVVVWSHEIGRQTFVLVDVDVL